MKLYWKQHKVYLYGQLAFLPKAIEGKVLRAAKLRHYFEADNLTAELLDYERGGYFKVEEFSDSTFKLIAINSQKFRDELDKYIKSYRTGKLTTGGSTKPDFESHQDRLWGAAAKYYEQHDKRHGYRPIINWQDIYSTSAAYGYAPPFWETVFTPVLAKQVELINIGYTKTTPDVPTVMLPLYEKPFVELSITDKEIKQAVASRRDEPVLGSPISDLTSPASMVTKSSELDTELQSVTVGVSIEGAIYVELANGEKRLIKKVRRDSAAYNFMNYMLGHQKQDISRGVVQTKVDGCAGKKNMTELAKLCGFTKELLPLKSLYFGGTTETNAHFKASADLNPPHVELVVQREKVIA